LDEYATWHLYGELHLQEHISSTEDNRFDIRHTLVEDKLDEVELTPATLSMV